MDFCKMLPERRKIAYGEGETSPVLSKIDYDVFLSFRGPDTRQGFVDCLYHTMKDAGICVFRDDDALVAGDVIDSLLQAIDSSKICVVVLSRTYADSPWCLREVERMVKLKKDIVPIFYDVTPDDVELKTQMFVDALTRHEINYEKERVQQWREALKEISRFKGRKLKYSGYVEFSRKLTKEMLTKLKVKRKCTINNLVELPDEVEAALKLLAIGSGGRRFLGIYGMGGIGKTTLAKIIFNQIYDNFDCSCFLENIREYLSQGQSGLHKLQEELLKSLDPRLQDAVHIVDPMKKIQNNFIMKKVMIVLDDIDQKNYIHSLVGDCSWFGTGSRIIFTTRNATVYEQLISPDAGIYVLEKMEMASKQALKLLSKHAFGEDSPPEDYKNLSSEVISMTGRLPLALAVVGSLLYRRKPKVWRETIKKLKEAPSQAVQQALKLSYDALEYEQQEIFLDIACFFIGEDKTNAVYMWEACGFNPDHGIEVLISMSFIKITRKKYFWMHDQLRDFGRVIVKENSEDPRAGSRYWMHKDAPDVLKRNAGKEKIEGLHVYGHSASLDREDFVGLEKLRFLRLTRHANFSGDFGGLMPKLRWLSLQNASNFSVTNLCLRELVVLELTCTFDETWRGWNQILISENLNVLTLSRCPELISTPDLSKLVNLKRLVLHRCEKLESIHSSIGKLRCLKRLTLTHCDFLCQLPEELTYLEGLKHIILNSSHLTSQFDLPESIGRLVSLTRLELQSIGVTKLPNSIGGLVKLKHLSLDGCKNLKVLPDSIGDLRSLVSLDLSSTGITKMPATVGRLPKLESLSLSRCYGLERLPDSIGNLHSLIYLDVSCRSIIELPVSFVDLTSLRKLDLTELRVRTLPDSIRDLENLEVLDIGSNKVEWIDESPELPIGLTTLRIYRVRKIQNLSNLINLSVLMISDGESGQSSEQLEILELEGIEKLNKLKELHLECSNVQSLPMEFSALQQLHSLILRCPNLKVMPPELPSSLESLVFDVASGTQPQIDLSNLKKLSKLELVGFVMETDGSKDIGLEGLESLEDLAFKSCSIEFNDFPVLRKVSHLRLDMCRSCWTFPDISPSKQLVTSNIDDLDEQVENEIPHIGSQLQISLSNLKNMSKLELENFVIEADGFQSLGVEGLESLENLEMTRCTIEFNDFPVLRSLTHLRLNNCHSARTFPDISRLGRLISLVIFDCEELVEIPGIRKLRSLRELFIVRCGSLRRIEDLSEFKELNSIIIEDCKKFEGIDGVDKLLLAGTVTLNISRSKGSSEGGTVVDAQGEDIMELSVVESNNQVDTHLAGMKDQGEEIRELSDAESKNQNNNDLVGMDDQGEEIMELLDVELESNNQMDNHLVGMEDQVKEIMKLLHVESGGVQFVGIHGIGGVGKTTLAKVVFNQLSTYFQGCSFVRDIQEKSKRKGLQYLQHQLLSEVLGANKDDDIEKIKDKIFNKKILIVLDDVDQKEQIKKLVGKFTWFGSGSRIIITTRNKNVMAIEHERFGKSALKWPKFQYFEMLPMEHDLALQLFSKHALGEDSSSNAHRITPGEVVCATGGLPLALEIVGSYLRDNTEEEWESTLIKLKKIRHQEIDEKLQISYETLGHEAKQIFLDIACFFCDRELSFPVYMWDACGYSPNQRIEVLSLLSLIKIVDDNKLWMHDRVRDFGRKIVRENAMEPANRSRLCVHDEILYVLEEKEETEKSKGNIEAIGVCSHDFPWGITLSRKELEGLPNLRYLELCRFQFAGDIDSCSLSNLKWLSWNFCPPDFRASNLHLESLAILDLSRSCISNQWDGWIQIKMASLKVLNLSGCKYLISTPDLSGYTKLESLILEDCVSLATIDSSIGKLERLKYLNLKGCISLSKLPEELCCAKGLEEILVSGKGQSFEVPEFVGGLTHLSILVVANVGITALPSDIGELKSLVRLDLSGADVTELPDSFGSMMEVLTVIKLSSSSIMRLPSSIGTLTKLEELNCRNCEGLQEIPSEIGGLYSLRILDLSFTGIPSLPVTIRKLRLLQTLYLESCDKLDQLPQLPESLVNLSVVSKLLRRIPDLSAMKSLIHLKLATGGDSSFDLNWVGKLYQLKTLELCFPIIAGLEFDAMTKLHSLCLSSRYLQCFSQLPSSLSRLFLAHINVKKIIPNLSRLKKLTFLELRSCSVADDDDEGWIGFAELQSVEHLSVHKCKFNSLPTNLRAVYISKCKFPDGVLDLTGLNHLVHLEIMDCKQLNHVRGVSQLEFLEEINICMCKSLETVDDLSNLNCLESLRLDSCRKLREVQGLDRVVDSLKQFEIYNCKRLHTATVESKKCKRKREE